MKIEYMPLEDLQRHERNPKTHDIPAIDKSISRFGYVNPIVIDERTGKIVAGHGRLDTLSEKFKKGEDPPPRIKQNGDGWLVPVVRGIEFKNDLEAEGYLIADNRLTELGGWDEQILTELLDSFIEPGFLEDIGFKPVDMPTDEDWAAQFEKDGNTKMVDGLAQITFVLAVGTLETLRAHLKTYDSDKNKAIAQWLNESSQ